MTEIKRTGGARLHVIKETKFKTVRILIRFREKMTEETLGKRVILSNLLETTNAAYPTQKAFSRKLSSLYGASFTTGVAKKGNQHLLSINVNIVNPKFVNFDTLGAMFAFLNNALFNPDVVESAEGVGFNPDVFAREQENLVHYLESMNDDRSYYASRQLSRLFFTAPKQALPSVGTVELIERETPEAVYDYYQKMLKTNVVDVFVLGDVDEKQVIKRFSESGFSDLASESAENESEDVFYAQDLLTDLSVLTEEKETAQSILQLGYHLPVSYGDKDYTALQVMNGLLGGFAHSKLFANVREKASLAYSISSTFDSFSGFLKIAAGIDASNYGQARQLIFEQLEAVKLGDFTEADINQTKAMLRNTYLIGQDSPSNNIELAYVKALVPERFLDVEAFLEVLEGVSKEEIQRVASSLTLQAEYFMKGESL